jgi:hypothetical protein
MEGPRISDRNDYEQSGGAFNAAYLSHLTPVFRSKKLEATAACIQAMLEPSDDGAQ